MFPAARIAQLVGGTLLRGDGATPEGVVHDSRQVNPGDLFVALPGERTDGHRFLPEAFARGACGAIVSDETAVPQNGRNLILVDDPLRALQALARAWRDTLSARFVGITGTCGKTTTKAILAHLLAGAHPTYAAPESFNTPIGLPLALLAMPQDAQVGVFELGVSAPGEIAPLIGLLRPDLAILTMVGAGHLAGFGSIDAVAREKWELVNDLPAGGRAILNADSLILSRLAPKAPVPVTTVGLSAGDLRGRIEPDGPFLRLAVDDPPMRLETHLFGAHNATNLLLAAAAALELGVAPEVLEARAASFEPIPHRLNLVPASFGHLLDDTYNANPDSTRAALGTLAELDLPVTQRGFVFGEMRELGNVSAHLHRKVLAVALALRIAPIIPLGEQPIAACREAARTDPQRFVFAPPDAPAPAIRAALPGDRNLLLVKGSRALGLEHLVDELTAP